MYVNVRNTVSIHVACFGLLYVSPAHGIKGDRFEGLPCAPCVSSHQWSMLEHPRVSSLRNRINCCYIARYGYNFKNPDFNIWTSCLAKNIMTGATSFPIFSKQMPSCIFIFSCYFLFVCFLCPIRKFYQRKHKCYMLHIEMTMIFRRITTYSKSIRKGKCSGSHFQGLWKEDVFLNKRNYLPRWQFLSWMLL